MSSPQSVIVSSAAPAVIRHSHHWIAVRVTPYLSHPMSSPQSVIVSSAAPAVIRHSHHYPKPSHPIHGKPRPSQALGPGFLDCSEDGSQLQQACGDGDQDEGGDHDQPGDMSPSGVKKSSYLFTSVHHPSCGVRSRSRHFVQSLNPPPGGQVAKCEMRIADWTSTGNAEQQMSNLSAGVDVEQGTMNGEYPITNREAWTANIEYPTRNHEYPSNGSWPAAQASRSRWWLSCRYFNTEDSVLDILRFPPGGRLSPATD